MNPFRANIHLKDAAIKDYERLDREMETERFVKLRRPNVTVPENGDRGQEYQYRGAGSLPEVTVAAYRAAHNTGKQYSFTIKPNREGHVGANN